MKKFVNHLFVAVGAIASVVTMVSFFFEIKWNNHPVATWLVIAAIVIACIIYACVQTARKKLLRYV